MVVVLVGWSFYLGLFAGEGNTGIPAGHLGSVAFAKRWIAPERQNVGHSPQWFLAALRQKPGACNPYRIGTLVTGRFGRDRGTVQGTREDSHDPKKFNRDRTGARRQRRRARRWMAGACPAGAGR